MRYYLRTDKLKQETTKDSFNINKLEFKPSLQSNQFE